MSDDIKILDTAEAIRSRPAMYFGDVRDPQAATRLLQEAICLALDAASCGTCTRITVTLHPDGSASVADNGPGVSLKPTREGITTAEMIMTALGACRQAKQSPAVAAATCGAGIAVMNALSEWCTLSTTSEGHWWRQDYRQGRPMGPFTRGAEATTTGTVVAFKPDPATFGDARFDLDALRTWLGARELKSVDMCLSDERR